MAYAFLTHFIVTRYPPKSNLKEEELVWAHDRKARWWQEAACPRVGGSGSTQWWLLALGWLPSPRLFVCLFVLQSGMPAHRMVLFIFRVGLPSLLNRSRNGLTDGPRVTAPW